MSFGTKKITTCRLQQFRKPPLNKYRERFYFLLYTRLKNNFGQLQKNYKLFTVQRSGNIEKQPLRLLNQNASG